MLSWCCHGGDYYTITTRRNTFGMYTAIHIRRVNSIRFLGILIRFAWISLTWKKRFEHSLKCSLKQRDEADGWGKGVRKVAHVSFSLPCRLQLYTPRYAISSFGFIPHYPPQTHSRHSQAFPLMFAKRIISRRIQKHFDLEIRDSSLFHQTKMFVTRGGEYVGEFALLLTLDEGNIALNISFTGIFFMSDRNSPSFKCFK